MSLINERIRFLKLQKVLFMSRKIFCTVRTYTSRYTSGELVRSYSDGSGVQNIIDNQAWIIEEGYLTSVYVITGKELRSAFNGIKSLHYYFQFFYC